MTKYSTQDLITIHNNIAKRKGLPLLDISSKMSDNSLADKIETVDKYKKSDKPEEKKELPKIPMGRPNPWGKSYTPKKEEKKNNEEEPPKKKVGIIAALRHAWNMKEDTTTPDKKIIMGKVFSSGYDYKRYAAIKYKDKVYVAFRHGDAMRMIIKSLKGDQAAIDRLDDELDEKDFGVLVNGKFVSGDSDMGRTVAVGNSPFRAMQLYGYGDEEIRNKARKGKTPLYKYEPSTNPRSMPNMFSKLRLKSKAQKSFWPRNHKASSVDESVQDQIMLHYPGGLHARPSTGLVKLAKGFASQIELGKTVTGPWVDAKSIVRVMGSRFLDGQPIFIKVTGVDEKVAMAAIQNFFNNKINEEIKGWKNAHSDIAKWRKEKADNEMSVYTHKIKKNGELSGMHDAKKYHKSVEDAKKYLEDIQKLNPNSDIKMAIFTNNKRINKSSSEFPGDYDGYRAIQYKGKVYTALTHDEALLKMIRSGIDPKKLDKELDEKNFGSIEYGKFEPNFSDLAAIAKNKKVTHRQVLKKWHWDAKELSEGLLGKIFKKKKPAGWISPRQKFDAARQQNKQVGAKFDATMHKLKNEKLAEDAPVNAAGGGQVAGIGIGPKGEPGGRRGATLVRRGKFAGYDTFIVKPHVFHNCKLGKRKCESYAKYVGEDETGQAIREYGRHWKTKSNPIIVQDEGSGAMTFLKYGGKSYGKIS